MITALNFLSFIIACLLLAKTIEMAFHCVRTVTAKKEEIKSVASAWPLTNLARKVKLLWLFRLPVLVFLSWVLLTWVSWKGFGIFFATVVFLSIWVQLAQSLLTRITFGYQDKYLRHWVFIVAWSDRENVLPKVTKHDAIKEMILFLIGFVAITILGYSSIYYILTSNDPLAFRGNIKSIWDCTYFSTVTFATVGYGDISPLSMFARLLTISEIFVSVGTIVLLILSYSMANDIDDDKL